MGICPQPSSGLSRGGFQGRQFGVLGIAAVQPGHAVSDQGRVDRGSVKEIHITDQSSITIGTVRIDMNSLVKDELGKRLFGSKSEGLPFFGSINVGESNDDRAFVGE